MADSRGFFKLTNGFPEHWKVEEVGGDAGWLHVCALAYCSRNLTDGLIPISLVPRLSDRENPKQLARALLDVGLWHAAGHECKKCVQPDARHYVIHDYLDHQTSAERARETSAKRAIAGQRGGKAKAAGNKLPSNLPGRGYDDASSKSLAEEEQEEELHKKKTSSSSRRRRNTRPVAARFEDFYRVYPRREAPADAEVAWTKAIEDVGADPQTVIDAAISYAMARKGKDPTYTKLPATWLNKRCWEDEATPAYNARSNGYQPYLEDAADQRPWAGEL